jgi:predicted nucleic acid-binding Zn finger protein
MCHIKVGGLSYKKITDDEYWVYASDLSVYKVDLKELACSCPDYIKGEMCEHIRFLLKETGRDVQTTLAHPPLS